MKISSDPGMVSALETWLRDTPDPEGLADGSSELAHTSAGLAHVPSGLAPVSAGSEPALQLSNSGATAPRDSAEGLLELDVWKGIPDGSRQLSSPALFQPRAAEAAGIIQGWTEHIFQPLV
jgi:hypothetical protein